MKIESILKLVSQAFQVDEEKIFSPSRDAKVVETRYVAMMFFHEMAGMSYSAIGRYFDRDHGTAMYGIASINEKVLTSGALAHKVGLLRATLVNQIVTTKTVLRPLLAARMAYPLARRTVLRGAGCR